MPGGTKYFEGLLTAARPQRTLLVSQVLHLVLLPLCATLCEVVFVPSDIGPIGWSAYLTMCLRQRRLMGRVRLTRQSAHWQSLLVLSSAWSGWSCSAYHSILALALPALACGSVLVCTVVYLLTVQSGLCLRGRVFAYCAIRFWSRFRKDLLL